MVQRRIAQPRAFKIENAVEVSSTRTHSSSTLTIRITTHVHHFFLGAVHLVASSPSVICQRPPSNALINGSLGSHW